MDHQMNMQISQEFGQYFVRLPLKKAATIVHGNALRLDWEDLVAKDKLSYILGNPPFIGSRIMKQHQRDELRLLFHNTNAGGILDYVTGWYVKAANYIQNTQVKVAFVSTNSIVQGEQVSLLWQEMITKYHIKIHFAHRTFKWKNEAKGNAAVFCIIVGFADFDINTKVLFEYENVNSEPHEVKVKNINPYLVDAKDIFITKSTKPISNNANLIRGSIPYDDGNLLLSYEQAQSLITKSPDAKIFIKRYGGAYELINNKWRYCLWLKDAAPEILKSNSFITNRIKQVFKFRSESSGQSVRSKASVPSLFGDIRQPLGKNYLMIPRVSSEKRKYIPIGFIDQSVILGDSSYGLPNSTMYDFGVLTSIMHMAWVKNICGRLKSDFRYSKDIVYNNFPWPENPSPKQIQFIEAAAQAVLEVRDSFPNSSLADLYGPLTMPPALTKAHQALDKAVDLAYRPQPFAGEAKRMEYLFELYEKYTANLFTKQKVKKKVKTA